MSTAIIPLRKLGQKGGAEYWSGRYFGEIFRCIRRAEGDFILDSEDVAEVLGAHECDSLADFELKQILWLFQQKGGASC